ncbi:unnamed protein product [Adineta steineri]|uniref:Alanine racemase C-terminal domain-containing protein n=2 Tax=Adineta steineri TaxID=433720 RepID=A0A814GP06_9BILA|nr:unnamed protein product [Adineta steineri]
MAYSASILTSRNLNLYNTIKEKYPITNAYFRSTWIDVNLSAVHANVRLLKEYIGEKVHLMAVVKGNGYGHGMLEIAEASISAGATWLGVASLDEALAIRSKSPHDIPILVLGYVAPQYVTLAGQFCITLAGISFEWIQEAARIAQQPFDFHLKIDTGLNRLGLTTIDEVQAVMKMVSLNPNLNCTGVFTHFATSEDIQNTSYFRQQLTRFHTFLDIITNRTNKIIHCANSGATLYQPQKPFFDMVRLGNALMGPPNETLKYLLPMQLQNALSLHSILDLVKQLNPGAKVGYGGEYTATQHQWIGTIPMGYADGWHQQFRATNVLVDGKRVPIIGRISMDQLMVALPRKYSTGTRVIFIGQQGNETILADEIAQKANQSRLEVFTSLSSRLPRIYRQDGSIARITNAMLNF